MGTNLRTALIEGALSEDLVTYLSDFFCDISDHLRMLTAHIDTLKGNFFVIWAISKILKSTSKSDECITFFKLNGQSGYLQLKYRLRGYI